MQRTISLFFSFVPYVTKYCTLLWYTKNCVRSTIIDFYYKRSYISYLIVLWSCVWPSWNPSLVMLWFGELMYPMIRSCISQLCNVVIHKVIYHMLKGITTLTTEYCITCYETMHLMFNGFGLTEWLSYGSCLATYDLWNWCTI